MRVTFEWWLAGDQPGDEIIKAMQSASNDQLKAMGWPSKSMWFNESSMLMLYALPKEYMKAIKTLAPGDSLRFPNFPGTLLSLSANFAVPPTSGAPFNNMTFNLVLTKRDTATLPESVFGEPAGYKQFDLQPILSKMHSMTLQDMVKEMENREKHRPGSSF